MAAVEGVCSHSSGITANVSQRGDRDEGTDIQGKEAREKCDRVETGGGRAAMG